MRFGDAARSVVRQMRVDFYADEPVVSLSAIVNWPQHICSHADICDFELFKQGCGIDLWRAAQDLLDRGVVIAAGRNRLFKDCRIAGYSTNPVLIDQLLKFSGGYQVATHVIKPD